MMLICKLGKIEQMNLLVIVYRLNGWGCGNQTFFGKRHTLTLLPKKFLWKTDKLILPPTYLKLAYILPLSEISVIFATPVELFRVHKWKKIFSPFVKQGKGFHLIYACWGLGCTPKRQKSKIWKNSPKYSKVQSWSNPSEFSVKTIWFPEYMLPVKKKDTTL